MAHGPHFVARIMHKSKDAFDCACDAAVMKQQTFNIKCDVKSNELKIYVYMSTHAVVTDVQTLNTCHRAMCVKCVLS